MLLSLDRLILAWIIFYDICLDLNGYKQTKNEADAFIKINENDDASSLYCPIPRRSQSNRQTVGQQKLLQLF